MEYIAVRWRHSNSAYPTELFSELGPDRYEVRKVEAFSDGRLQYADSQEEIGGTMLGVVPVPPLEEIVDEEFTPRQITANEFEAMWLAARQSKPPA
jgi:hypothetical protein